MYMQIAEQIKRRVAVAEWAAGQEIPSIRQLAADLCVSVITVKRAYLELEREGVIVTQHGKGSSIAPTAAVNPRMREEELTGHLEKAAELGQLLGLTGDELATRLENACEQLIGDQQHKETR